jgi:hypothetical protein
VKNQLGCILLMARRVDEAGKSARNGRRALDSILQAADEVRQARERLSSCAASVAERSRPRRRSQAVPDTIQQISGRSVSRRRY